MATTRPFFKRLRPFAGPVSLLAVAAMGIVLPFTVASSVPTADADLMPALPMLEMARVEHGREVYSSTCIACHAADAKGVASLGKDLTTGYARSSGDSELIAMITRGRQPGEAGHTAAVPMPPKGGRADLTRTDIADIVAYLRGLQTPSRLPQPLSDPVEEVEPAEAVAANVTPVTAAPSVETAPAQVPPQAETAAVVAQPVAFNSEAAARGKRVFTSCMACHGKNGTGTPNVGADLVHSAFVAKKSDSELVAFIKKGRQPTDPETVMKLTMPPKGGNPALKDKQLEDVVAYLRSLQAAGSASK